jgi:hypothetical protein
MAQVLDWAKANVRDRTYIVCVVAEFVPGGGAPSLIRLLGEDPNAAPCS